MSWTYNKKLAHVLGALLGYNFKKIFPSDVSINTTGYLDVNEEMGGVSLPHVKVELKRRTIIATKMVLKRVLCIAIKRSTHPPAPSLRLTSQRGGVITVMNSSSPPLCCVSNREGDLGGEYFITTYKTQ